MNTPFDVFCKSFEIKPTLRSDQPIIVRLDGRAFHSVTRKCTRPYDRHLHLCMHEAAKAVCADTHGCKIAYAQSDEMTFLLSYGPKQEPHFAGEIQKICSTMAALASVVFYQYWCRYFELKTITTFDARCYNVPAEAVIDIFNWRQTDAERNALFSVCYSQFSHKELLGKEKEDQKLMLRNRGIDFDELPTAQRLGACIVKETYSKETDKGPCIRSRWIVDFNIPKFRDNPEYITSLLEEPWNK